MRDIISNMAPTAESAVFRAQNPKSWWWTPDIDFLAAVLYALQISNWQRAGGGSKPTPVKRPKDMPKVRRRGPRVAEPHSRDELEQRRRRVRRV